MKRYGYIIPSVRAGVNTGKDTKQEKRIVSVGLIPFDGTIFLDTIFIDLFERVFGEGREILARAYAMHEFEYMGDSRLNGHSTKLVSNLFMKEVTIPYNQFIEGIAKANSAEVKYGRLIADSLDLITNIRDVKKVLEGAVKQFSELDLYNL